MDTIKFKFQKRKMQLRIIIFCIRTLVVPVQTESLGTSARNTFLSLLIPILLSAATFLLTKALVMGWIPGM